MIKKNSGQIPGLKKKLSLCEEKYRRIISAVTDYVVTVYMENNWPIRTVHADTCEVVTGYSPSEFDKDPYLWIRMVPAEDRAIVTDQVSAIISGKGAGSIEHRIIRKDGVIKWVRNTCIPNYDDKKKLTSYVGLIKDITERKQAQEELRQLNEGLERRVEVRTSELVEINRRLSDEIAERKMAQEEVTRAYSELNETQQQLIQAEKMQTVGRLASGVAHEVKNPLAIILLGVDYLRNYVKTDNVNASNALTFMEEAVKRADKIIKGLLDFSVVSDTDFKPEDLDSVIADSVRLVRGNIDKNRVNVTIDVPKSIPPIVMDRNKMQQVFINLFLNAAQAMPKGGELKIKARLLPYDGKKALIIEITDTGTGLPKEVSDRLFEPFVTTRRGRGGAGLGLSIVKNIMQIHNGQINIKNRETGKGVEAVLRLKA